MLMPVILIAFGALSRLIPHEPNAVALGAVAIFAGARYSRSVAWMIPVAAMIASDLVIDWGSGASALSVSRLTIYATYAAITLIGRLGRTKDSAAAGSASTMGTRPLVLGGLSLAASLTFFVTTNFAEWAAGPLALYPHTWSGLVACYAAAIPFFQNTIAADLVGVAGLFLIEGLATRPAAGVDRRKPGVELIEA